MPLGRKPQQARSREKVQAILDAAEAIIVTVGLGGLTMRKVATGSGVGQATLYGYFPTLDTLVTSLAARVLETVGERLRALPPATPETTALDLSNAYLDAFIDIYEGERLAHQVFEAILADDPSIEDELLDLTGFTSRFSDDLQAIAPHLRAAERTRIAMAYYRIADAFLWQEPPEAEERAVWRQLLSSTLCDVLTANTSWTAPPTRSPSP